MATGSSYTQQKYHENTEKVITNPLVVCIGISKYKKSIPDILDVKHDICQYSKTLLDYYNYKVISNKYNQFCSRNTIKKFLNESSHKYPIHNNGKILFDGLIITISGHCNRYSLLCSDGEYIKFNDILSIFTNTWNNKYPNLNVNVPKFLIVDGNRGYKLYDTSIQTELETLNYTGIIRSSSSTNSLAYGGEISWNVCKIFEQFKDRKYGLLFHNIIIELKQRILSQSIYQKDKFSFISNTDINLVIFRVNTNTKGTQMIVSQTRYRALSAPVYIGNAIVVPLKPPVERLLPMPFTEKDKWNKIFKIITKECNKMRVKIEWLFMLNNTTHNAVLTHSQKRKSWIASSRTLYIDGIKMYSNRSKHCIFIKMIDGYSLKFKIQCIDDKYKYLMSIDKISHQIAYEQWKLKQIHTNTNTNTNLYEHNPITLDAKNKKLNWIKNDTKFSALFNYVPD
eukprot:274593_1